MLLAGFVSRILGRGLRIGGLAVLIDSDELPSGKLQKPMQMSKEPISHRD